MSARALLSAALTAALPAPRPAAAPDAWQPLRDAIDAFTLVPNAAVIVGNASGRLFAHAKGTIDMDSVMPIASATKWVGGVAIMTAVRDGHLSLDDYAWQHLPYWTRDSTDLRSHVTLRSALAFNTGFVLDGGLAGCGLLMDFEACTRHIYDNVRHVHCPGTHFNYGEAGVHLHIAGQMAAAAAGVTMQQLIDRSVFGPLGMTNSFFLPNPTNPELAGALTTNGVDYEKFLDAYFNHRILPATLRSEMERHQYPEAEYAHDSTAMRSGHYGLGNWFACEYLAGEQWRPECTVADVHHSVGAFGWWPSTDRRYDYYSMIAMFMSSTEGRLFQNEIKPIMDAIVQGVAPPPVAPMTAARLAALQAQVAAAKPHADLMINASKY